MPRLLSRQMKSEQGFSLLETVIALGLLGIIAVCFLGSQATATKATFISNELATAESLVRSEIEYVKNSAYQQFASEYAVDPALSMPGGWTMSPPAVEPVHASDDGIQNVTVTVERNGEVILSINIYKVDKVLL